MAAPDPTPADLIASVLPDGGTRLLSEAGLPGDWKKVLARVPPALFARLPSEDRGVAALTLLRDLWSQHNQLRPAIAATRALMRIRIEKNGHDHPDTLVELGALGALAQRGGQLKEAEEFLQKAYSKLRSRVTGRDLRLAVVAQNLGVFYVAKKDWKAAEQHLQQALKIRRTHEGASISLLAAQLAEVMLQLGQTKEAIPLLREAWMGHLDELGKDHPRTRARARTLAHWLMQYEMYREAGPVLREVHRAAVQEGDPEQLAMVGFDLGVALYHTWKKEEGLRLIEDSLRWTRDAGDLSKPHPALPSRLTMFAHILAVDKQRLDQAEGLVKEALEAERTLYGDASVQVGLRYASLGYFNHGRGRNPDALGWLDVATSLLKGLLPPGDERLLKAASLQADLMIAQAMKAWDANDRHLAKELTVRVKRVVELLPEKAEQRAAFAKLEKYRPGAIPEKGGMWRPPGKR